jgi:hypothetical protein
VGGGACTYHLESSTRTFSCCPLACYHPDSPIHTSRIASVQQQGSVGRRCLPGYTVTPSPPSKTACIPGGYSSACKQHETNKLVLVSCLCMLVSLRILPVNKPRCTCGLRSRYGQSEYPKCHCSCKRRARGWWGGPERAQRR